MTDQAGSEHLEPGGVSTRGVLIAAAGSMMLLAASMVGFALIFYAAVPGDRTPTIEKFPRPRLEPNPAVELHNLIVRQRADLETYRWANTGHTRVAIPIERAMQIIAGRGDRAFAPVAAGPAPAAPGGGTL
jgi:hypothetical protein